MPKEVLVVAVDTDLSDALLAEIARHARVTQLLLPRIALVVPDDRGAGGLRTLPGVAVYTDSAPPLGGFDDRERLFVDAWSSRGREKARPADGSAWDAPGRVPPDLPPTARR